MKELMCNRINNSNAINNDTFHFKATSNGIEIMLDDSSKAFFGKEIGFGRPPAKDITSFCSVTFKISLTKDGFVFIILSENTLFIVIPPCVNCLV